MGRYALFSYKSRRVTVVGSRSKCEKMKVGRDWVDRLTPDEQRKLDVIRGQRSSYLIYLMDKKPLMKDVDTGAVIGGRVLFDVVEDRKKAVESCRGRSPYTWEKGSVEDYERYLYRTAEMTRGLK